MRRLKNYLSLLLLCDLLSQSNLSAQSNNPAPYPGVTYAMVPCNQTGPSQTPTNTINDFIHSFNTTGGLVNINNNNSGCCGMPNNYIYYGCNHILAVNPGQTITCNIQSGIIFAQGFALWVDWNLDNQFSTPAERIGTAPVMTPAGTWTTMTFVVPPNQPTGTYRMRVRCVFAQNGNTIVSNDIINQAPQYTFGETEDYNLYVGFIPNTIITATASSPQPTICAGQSISLTALNSAISPTYSWTGPASFTSTLANPVIPNASPLNSGTYSVTVSNGACPVSKTVAITVVPIPTISLVSAVLTTCQGGSVTAQANAVGSNNNFNFTWTGQGNLWTPTLPSTHIFPPLLSSSVTTANFLYTVSATPKAAVCPVTQVLTVTVNNPPLPTFATHPLICNVSSVLQLTATPAGGTWSNNPAVQTGGQFNPALAAIGTNTVSYTAGVGLCLITNTTTIRVSKFHTAALSSTPALQCSKGATLNLMNIVQDTTTGSWSGIGFNITNNIFNPTGLPTGTYAVKYFSPSFPDSLVCPDSVTLFLPLFNPPVPVISAIAPKCNTAQQITLTATPVGGIWTGNSGVTQAGVQTPSLNQVGTNTVIYTAGQGTCTSSSSKTFEVSQYRTATLTAGIPSLCVTSVPVDLMNLALDKTGDWSGQSVNSNNFFNPAGLPTYTYVLKYKTTSTPNATLCPDSSFVSAYVLNPTLPQISAVGPICSKDAAFQLTVTPATGKWTANSYLSQNGIFTPSLAAPGSNPVQYVIGTSGCNAKQTIQINVETFIPATILHKLPDFCENGLAVNLSPFTANNAGHWSGPGMVGNTFAPAQTGAGQFTLTYNTSSSPSGLCPDKSELVATVFPLAVPEIAKVGPFCNTALPVKLIANPTGGIFGGGVSGITPDGLFNPGFAHIGDNILNYTVQVGPCTGYAQTTIQVQPFVSAEMLKQPEQAYCKTAEAFNLNSLARNPGGVWTGPGVTGSMFDPKKANIGSNNIITYQTVSAPVASLCADSKTIQLKVKDLPVATAKASVLKGCAPVEINFSSPENLNGTSYWTLSDGSGKLHGNSVNYTFTKSGTYDVVYNYSDDEALGCSTQVVLKDKVEIYPVPYAAFSTSPEEVTVSDPAIQITNLSTPLSDSRYWWVVEGVNLYDDVHPYVRFPQAGNYRITLKATNIHGCIDEASKIVTVKNEFNVFIPNSFTPNFDGINDVFMPVFSPYGLSAETYLMEIFDRWGHLIFTSKDFRTGWNGSYNNKGDEILKEDSYTVRLRYKDLEGNSYTKLGTVVLLK